MPNRARNPLMNHVRAIRKALTAINMAAARLVVLANRAEQGVTPAGATPKRKLNLSPKRRAELKLQGRYLGYMRQLKPRQKAQVKAIKAKGGIEAAVRAAKRLRRG